MYIIPIFISSLYYMYITYVPSNHILCMDNWNVYYKVKYTIINIYVTITIIYVILYRCNTHTYMYIDTIFR